MGKSKESFQRRMPKGHTSHNKYRNLRNYFEECTNYSSLDGLKYLGESNRTLAEKIVWTIIIILSIVACSYYLMQTYEKWDNTPILVTVGTTQLPIRHITFPAVTICPATKITTTLKDILDKFDGGAKNVTRSEILSFKHTQMWCHYKRHSEYLKTFGVEETYNLSTLDFIYRNSPPMHETFWVCLWSNEVKNCSDILVPTFTEDGLCYTFNGIDRSDLFKKGVLRFRNFNTAKNTSCYDDFQGTCRDWYPYRTSSGIDGGFQVRLTVPKNHLNPCVDSSKGHKVIIHQPNELPSTRNNYFYIPLTQSVLVALAPEVIKTDESLRSYTVEQRKCYYDDEKNLTHFKYYTQRNCETECYLHAMKSYLECSDFYMPHTNANTTLCNATDSDKFRSISHHIKSFVTGLKTAIPANIYSYLSAEKVPAGASEVCNCLPSCKSLKYHAEITQTDYDEHDKGRQLYKNFSEEDVKYSMLAVYFKVAEFLPYERNEMFGLMDFIAYCGGLLGLFIGFSFITLLEIIYFVSFRPIANIFLFGKELWTGIYKLDEPVEEKQVDSTI